jgi:hypothetical protein
VQHEVVADAGYSDRVELERAEPAEDREDCIRATFERARRREELAGDEKAARVRVGDRHLGDAIAGPVWYERDVVNKSAPQNPGSPSELIDARIRELDDWRGEMLARLRALVKEADPEVVEEWKWKGTPVWSHDGIICTGETYKSVVKMTFAKGASLEDPSGLFNSSLEGNTRRAIDFREGEKIDEKALKALVRSAVALNTSR